MRKVKPVESHTFAGMETAVADQATAAAIQQAEELTAKLLEPLADISAKAGRLERESPLFYGTGDNPTLFNWEPAPQWALDAKEGDNQ